MHPLRPGSRAWHSAEAATVWEGGLAQLSKNHQPNETSMSTSPKCMHSLLPLPGTHRAPRRMDVDRHLHLYTGVQQRSEGRISITDFWLLLGLSADWAEVCSSSASCVAHWSHHTRLHYHTLRLSRPSTCKRSRGLALDIGPSSPYLHDR
jgi:hypothetical protein